MFRRPCLQVQLTTVARSLLDLMCRSKGLNETDVVNRSIQAYAFIDLEQKKGHQLAIYDPEAKTYTPVTIS
jgi:hypothetical protein